MKRHPGVALVIGSALLFCWKPAAGWAQPDVELEAIVAGLPRPVAITHAPDGSGRMFFTLLAGRIVVYDGEKVLPIPFLDIEADVSCCGERGLFSVAFHPQFATNGYFFVSYTDNDGDSVIARYTVAPPGANRADAASEVVLLTIDQPFQNHNGGQLHFGPDGYLYIGTGDGGSGGDPLDNGQDLATLLGKLLRIDVDVEGNGALPYEVPADNPFVLDATARHEIWAYGLRNPWRFSFDRFTGDLFIGDVGQNAWEEIDFQPSTSPGGENYGWRLMEGAHCFNPSSNCNDGSLVLPILEYGHSPECSVTGGYRYRGGAIPELDGRYVYGDLCSGRIWGASESGGGTWSTEELLDTSLSITSFGEDDAGELYVTGYADVNGGIYRFVEPVAGSGPEIRVSPLSLAFGPQPLDGGATGALSIQVQNVGTLDLPITNVGIGGPDADQFALVGDSGETSLPPGATRTLTVAFDPGRPGEQFAMATILAGDPDEGISDVTLTGLGTVPREVSLTNGVITTNELFAAAETLTAGPDFVIGATGDVTFLAGVKIVLQDGFSVEEGAALLCEIDPSLVHSGLPEAVVLRSPPSAVTSGGEPR